MKLRHVSIKNFRSLVDVSIPIEDSTVLVGENNSGKTAFLEAMRIALPFRTSFGKSSPFNEYDFHVFQNGDSFKTSPGIIIELWFREDQSDEWPEPLVQDLTDIIQTDPEKDLDFIGLRLSCKYDGTAAEVVSKWEFLTPDGQPLGGRGANPANLGKFLAYLRFFYLSSLRDSEDEFTSRSQFWGRILRELQIPDEQQQALSAELSKLNESLLKADPKLGKLQLTLDKASQIMGLKAGHNTTIQALPLKPWELMSKSEVVMRATTDGLPLPLSRHGQGMQSLSVLFLFQAYIDVLLKPTFKAETEAILALEEPEAHLHPHATRTLAASLHALESQKLISTHSPYFIQEIPFEQIRMFRRKGTVSKALYIHRFFEVNVPASEDLIKFCSYSKNKYQYDSGSSLLRVYGKIEEQEYKNLLACYPGQKEIHTELRKVKDRSQCYLSKEQLADLETYAKRVRGEVLFARSWLLCEGQSEYLLLQYLAGLLGTPLDQFGITVIDFQNNGSPGAFVGLARSFDIPWLMVCDSDSEGQKFYKQVLDCGFTATELKDLVRQLPDKDVDIESYLVRNGFLNEYLSILKKRGTKLSKQSGQLGFEDEVVAKLKSDKMQSMIALINELKANGAGASKVPPFLAKIIQDVIAKAS
ncbi:MAG: AAA family ATPase [Acidobacteria bacterium]|nr:AAA family ATPase [Acidobacteriota bacterium]